MASASVALTWEVDPSAIAPGYVQSNKLLVVGKITLNKTTESTDNLGLMNTIM